MPDVSTSAAFCRLLQPTHHHARHPAMPQAGFMNLFNFEPEKMHIRCMAHHARAGSFTVQPSYLLYSLWINTVVLPFTFSLPPIKAVDGRKIGIRMTVNIFLGVLCYRLLLSKLSLLLPSSGSSCSVITLNLWSFHCWPRRLMLPWPSSPLVNPTPSSFSFSSSSFALTL